MPARGGADPEPMSQAKLYAPQAFRTQERAVTEADYAAAAQRHPDVQRAACTRAMDGHVPHHVHHRRQAWRKPVDG